MLRIRFGPADLARVTVATAPDVLLETALSVRHLVAPAPGPAGRRGELAAWRRAVAPGLAARAGVLTRLVRPTGGLPDFLYQPTARDAASAAELAARTPTARLAAELAVLPEDPTASLTRDLAQGSPAARRRLFEDLTRYHRSSVAPLWPAVLNAAAADRALRSETLLRGGVEALLATLQPGWRWEPPDLLVPFGSSHTVELCGRGLHLVPSYFAAGALLVYDPSAPTVLVRPLPVADRAVAPGDVLGALLGRTRAQVLASLSTPAGTTALAERAAVSPATASEHASVLRAAGLITTVRDGSRVLHALTPLGEALLAGG
ncbi:ArsR/SmtB family transcription factor [Streptomyces nigra]|uniref:ArsR/SmtB family transcription factor n=1 Tax=Streptomyces TaxID=1883 RepID=UPI001B398062|nr:winged helix-turn-helix domain-containing protein [Streptomyces sp. RK62]MBQ0999669.1 winged helix-turn-helix transcriptional regulator [Streptomyces sp. RK62]